MDSSAFGRLGGAAEVQVVQHKPCFVLGDSLESLHGLPGEPADPVKGLQQLCLTAALS